MVSEGVKQPTEETPRAATHHSRRRSTTSERLSSGAGRSDPKRILRCGQLDDSPIRAAPGPSPRLLPSPTRRIPMNTPTSNPPVVAWVGLDWADQRHEIRLQAAGSPRLESFSVEQKPEAFQAWVAELRARFPQGRIALALEHSRGAVIYALMNYDFFLLYPIPPKTLARYREAFASSGAKSDRSDADLLLELVRTHGDRLRAWQPDDAMTRQLRLLVEYRRKTVADRTRLTNRLTDLLKTYFPQALDWLGDLRSLAACEFLGAWPTLQAVQGANRPALRPRLAAAFGTDRDRYQSAEEIQQFSGIAPVTAASGKMRWVHWRWACPKFLRQTFHEFADASRKKSLWARAYYQQQRQHGVSHHAAVRALAYKWIRILYRCWKTRTPYDEALYLRALQRRHSPLWLAAASLSTQEAHP